MSPLQVALILSCTVAATVAQEGEARLPSPEQRAQPGRNENWLKSKPDDHFYSQWQMDLMTSPCLIGSERCKCLLATRPRRTCKTQGIGVGGAGATTLVALGKQRMP